MPTANFIGSPITLTLGVTSVNTQLQQNTYYRLWCSVNAFVQFGADSTVSATTLSHPLTAGLDTLHYTGANLNWMSGIVATGTGVLYASAISTGAAG